VEASYDGLSVLQLFVHQCQLWGIGDDPHPVFCNGKMTDMTPALSASRNTLSHDHKPFEPVKAVQTLCWSWGTARGRCVSCSSSKVRVRRLSALWLHTMSMVLVVITGISWSERSENMSSACERQLIRHVWLNESDQRPPDVIQPFTQVAVTELPRRKPLAS